MGITHNTGGGGGDLVLIETILLASDTASITFDNIPATYSDLIITGRVRSDDADSTDLLEMTMGGTAVDTGASDYDYAYVVVQGDSGTNAQDHGAASVLLGVMPGNTTVDPGKFSALRVEIMDYTDTAIAHSGHSVLAGYWHSTPRYRNYHTTFNHVAGEAIDIITFAPVQGSNLLAATRLSLYGVGSSLV